MTRPTRSREGSRRPREAPSGPRARGPMQSHRGEEKTRERSSLQILRKVIVTRAWNPNDLAGVRSVSSITVQPAFVYREIVLATC
jgi:hypothetical protein